MSMTSLIREHKVLRDSLPFTKTDLVDQAGQPLGSDWWKQPIKVESIGARWETARIGTAFDYVARALIERKVGAKQTKRQPWVAEDGFQMLLRAVGHSGSFVARLSVMADEEPEYEHVSPALAYILMGSNPILFAEFTPVDFRGSPEVIAERQEGWKLAQEHDMEILENLVERWAYSVTLHDEFLASRATIAEYTDSALFLASLDSVFRAHSVSALDWAFQDMEIKGYPAGKCFFSQNQSVAIEELASNIVALSELMEEWLDATPMTSVVLNPTFGMHSGSVGGADADLIFDTTLVDFKTQKELKWDAKDWAQVTGYASFALDLDRSLDAIVVYFARFGVTAMLEITPARREQFAEYLRLIQSVSRPRRL